MSETAIITSHSCEETLEAFDQRLVFRHKRFSVTGGQAVLGFNHIYLRLHDEASRNQNHNETTVREPKSQKTTARQAGRDNSLHRTFNVLKKIRKIWES